MSRQLSSVPAFTLTLSGLMLWLTCAPARAEIIVTSLRAPRPAIVGRFAAITCTLKNAGRAAAAIKVAAIKLVKADGKSIPFAVSTLTPQRNLRIAPGRTYTFQQFQRIKAAGEYTCAVEALTGAGRWTALRGADGKRARATFRAVAAARVPQVQYEVVDPKTAHVYAPGDTIRVKVLPVFTGGEDLTPLVSAVRISTPTKPFSMTDAADARKLLTGKYDVYGFTVDFWGVEEGSKHVDIEIPFKQPVELSSFAINGLNLNGEYSLQGCEVEMLPSGQGARAALMVVNEGNRWTVRSALRRSVKVTGLRLSLSTPYKINLTGITLRGATRPGGAKTASPVVTAAWRDGFGRSLGKPIKLKLYEQNAVASPARLEPGYYGLCLTASIPGVDTTQREFGFAVLPATKATGKPATDARFGMVHMNIYDTRLGVGAVKTLATPYYDGNTRKLDVASWQSAITERNRLGEPELPLICDGDWASDDAKPISAEKLQTLQDKMEQYFRATPNVPYWELGIEENLRYREKPSSVPYYWPNLEAKAKAVQEAARAANSPVKFIYQIAERDLPSIKVFCSSAASRYFDVLSLHPYAWPDFPAPEKWMPEFLEQVHAIMKRAGSIKPIWFTEIGAPHNGNPGGFFGYPSIPVFDRGLGRDEYAGYMVKCYLVGMRLGVGRLYWYNYQDNGSDPEYAECFFGIVDAAGYPKPAYTAYSAMSRALAGRMLAKTAVTGGNVQVYRFQGERQDCVVAWTYPAAPKTVTLASLGLVPAKVAGVKDMMGKPVAVNGGRLPLNGYPVYITVNR